VGTLQSSKGQLNNLLLLGEGIVWQQDGHFVGETLTPVGPARLHLHRTAKQGALGHSLARPAQGRPHPRGEVFACHAKQPPRSSSRLRCARVDHHVCRAYVLPSPSGPRPDWLAVLDRCVARKASTASFQVIAAPLLAGSAGQSCCPQRSRVFRGAIRPRQDRFSRRKPAFLSPDSALKSRFHGGLSRRWPYENVRSHPYPISCDQLGQAVGAIASRTRSVSD